MLLPKALLGHGVALLVRLGSLCVLGNSVVRKLVSPGSGFRGFGVRGFGFVMRGVGPAVGLTS